MKKSGIKLNRNSLTDILANNNRGNEAINIVIRTVPKMKKTDNPYFGQITKVSVMNVNINFDYENAVNNRLQKEGKSRDFQSAPRSWGTPIAGTPLVVKEGTPNTYPNFRPIKTIEVKYFHNDGREIAKSDLEPWLPNRSGSSRQGTDETVQVRTVDVANIQSIKMRGQLYELTE